MIKIAICDDEEHSVNKIKKIIIGYEKTRDIQFTIKTFLSGENLIRNFDNYELIFLDIDMPELDGLEVARRLRQANIISKIIYVTSHAHFTSQALSIHAFGYIVKPFEDKMVFALLEDFINYFNIETQAKNKKISFKTTQGVVCLSVEDIFYFEYIRPNGVRIVTVDKILYTRSSLQDVLKMVEDHGFASPHKSFVVNLFHIDIIDGINILMKNGDAVSIAQKRVSGFRAAHNRFLRGS